MCQSNIRNVFANMQCVCLVILSKHQVDLAIIPMGQWERKGSSNFNCLNIVKGLYANVYNEKKNKKINLKKDIRKN